MWVPEQRKDDETGCGRSQSIADPEYQPLIQVIDIDTRQQAKWHGRERKGDDSYSDHDRRVGHSRHDSDNAIIGGVKDAL